MFICHMVKQQKLTARVCPSVTFLVPEKPLLFLIGVHLYKNGAESRQRDNICVLSLMAKD